MQGKIKKIISGKGFGFITTEESDKDIFFHKSNLKESDIDNLVEDTIVEFELQDGTKGKEAVNVTVIR
ncbi:MAG: cold shock domain-containing protein [Candidatus Heimdallarchaeota archaeon]|nr:cold shock domain-containing protein [Candidatus Heimdallarchaeota archaeon]MDH5645179.1 cold shock domain-containing protein [Candidatus Heimdallarchaeota archaeon]